MDWLLLIDIKDNECAHSIISACKLSDINAALISEYSKDKKPDSGIETILLTDSDEIKGDYHKVLMIGNHGNNEPDKQSHILLQKPLSIQRLINEIITICRNTPETAKIIKFNDQISFDPSIRKISDGTSEASLTDKESELLKILLEHRGEILAKEDLLKIIWGYDKELDTHTLQSHIYRLRNKCLSICEEFTIISKDGGYGIDLSD